MDEGKHRGCIVILAHESFRKTTRHTARTVNNMAGADFPIMSAKKCCACHRIPTRFVEEDEEEVPQILLFYNHSSIIHWRYIQCVGFVAVFKLGLRFLRDGAEAC